MPSDAEKAVDLAKQAVHKAMTPVAPSPEEVEIDEEELREQGRVALQEAQEEGLSRRPFTITKFGRHAEGHFHARITPAHGKPIYAHCRYGSWMAPGENAKGQPILREIMPHVARELQVKARAIEKAERLEAERLANREHNEKVAQQQDETRESVA